MNINFNWLDILFAIVIIYNVFLGVKEGFVKTLSDFCKFIVAFFAARFFHKSLAEYLTVNSGIYTSINKRVTEIISSISAEEATAEGLAGEINLDFIPKGLSNYIEDLIMKSQNSLQGFVEHFSENLSQVIFEAVCFVAVFIIALIVWKVITLIVDKIMGLPVLRQVNGLGGFAIGLMKGFFFCVLISTLFFVISMTGMPVLTDALNASMLAKYFYIGFILDL